MPRQALHWRALHRRGVRVSVDDGRGFRGRCRRRRRSDPPRARFVQTRFGCHGQRRSWGRGRRCDKRWQSRCRGRRPEGSLSHQPFPQAWILRQTTGHHIRRPVILAAVDDAEAFLLRQTIDQSQQCLTVRRTRIHEQVHHDGATAGQFARGEGFDAVVADQIDQLESFVETHAVSIIIRNG